jgi:hypothetical protein
MCVHGRISFIFVCPDSKIWSLGRTIMESLDVTKFRDQPSLYSYHAHKLISETYIFTSEITSKNWQLITYVFKISEISLPDGSSQLDNFS